MRRLENKIVIVTGGAAGIGAAAALRLASEGAAVAIGDIDSEGAAALAQRINGEGGRAIGVHCDVSDEASAQNLVARTVAEFGGVDSLFANAGNMKAIMEDHDAVTVALDIFDATIAVNLRGQLLCTRYVIPELLKRGGGSIVYTSSGASSAGETVRVSYAMTKSGVEALMRHVANRWGRDGIRANAIAPGFVVTPRMDANMPDELKTRMIAGTPSTRLGKPDDIAAVVALLASVDGEWVNGQVLNINGGVIQAK